MENTRPNRRFWLLAPGEKARLWEDFQQEGIVAIGWDYLGNLRQYATQKEISDKIAAEVLGEGKPINDSKACYEFAHTMNKGDIVIAKYGNSAYLGYGIVEGAYRYDENRAEYRHTRPVSWKKSGRWMDDNGPIVQKTLTDITKYPLYVKKLIRLLSIKEVSQKESDGFNNEVEIYAPLIARYQAMIKSDDNIEEIYKWEALNHFQHHFDLEAEDFGDSLKEALAKQYNLLYSRAVMFLKWCADRFPEELRQAFRVLLDEERPLPDRFKEYESRCEGLVAKLKDQEQRDNIDHYQDERSKAFFLAMYYPERYFIYKNEVYKYLIGLLGEPSEKAGRKYFHYRLIMESFHDILCRDEELLQLHKNTLTEVAYPKDATRLLAQDIVYRNMKAQPAPDPSPEAEEKEKATSPMTIKNPLNQILYGPPGTGKTYSTVDLAAKIIGFDTGSHAENLKAFNQRTGKNIEFVTFHQSFTYEDFIEGIKPQTSETKEQGKQVTYDVQDGVFKKLAKRARKASLSLKTQESQVKFERAFDELKNELAASENDEIEIPMKRVSYHITGISSDYIQFRKSSGGTGHDLKVDVLRKMYTGDLQYAQEGLGIYYHPLVDYLKGKSEQAPQTEEEKTEEPHVLIIDEINRGNVAAIFGELITLIEEDKRAGGRNPISITLPYSKTAFSVPSNLYLIGTMNTADRSVEALDTALRRRFSFTEVGPNPTLLKDIVLEYPNGNQLNLGDLLSVINYRIARLIDRDHMIGHAYFMGIAEVSNSWSALKAVFHRNLLPLLREYFFGDSGKIGLVLGGGFVKAEEDEASFGFAAFEHATADDFSERKLLRIEDVLGMEMEDFQEAIRNILPESNTGKND